MINNLQNVDVWKYLFDKAWGIILVIIIANLILIFWEKIPRKRLCLIVFNIIAVVGILVGIISIRTCNDCHTIIENKYSYCAGCGRYVNFDTKSLENFETQVQCYKCLKYHNNSDKYCPICGAHALLSKAKVERIQCEECRRYTEFINQYCPHCGVQLEHEEIEEEKPNRPLDNSSSESSNTETESGLDKSSR